MAAIKEPVVRATLMGTEPPQDVFPETATQTYKASALVVLTSGKLVECGADPVAILGLACRSGQNIAAPLDVGVYLLTGDCEVEMNVKGTAALNNIQAADLGVQYGLVKDASGHWVVDKDDTTAKRVTIKRFIDIVGEANGRVIVHFRPAVLQLLL